METTRRRFIQICGFSLASLGLGALAKSVSAQTKILPGPKAFKGKRWAMVVDPAKCLDGCTDCIQACNQAHNVPHIPNHEEEIKWIWTEDYEHAFTGQEYEFVDEKIKDQPFIVLCNHCAKPPCVRVCPTKATFKRASDGIVMMDWHRCIGCRFCMAACPYGSRSFNWADPRVYMPEPSNPDFPTRAKGVVEKCTFCAERLDRGLVPACVEACAKKGREALVFGDLEDPQSKVRQLLRQHYAIRRKPELGTNPGIYYIV